MNKNRIRLALGILAVLPMSSCSWCTERFVGFEWRFAETQPDVWEVIEGADLLGTPGLVDAACGDVTDDATCTNLSISPRTAGSNPDFSWALDIVAVMPGGFSPGLLEPATRLQFFPDCSRCCETNPETGGFVPNGRPAVITSGTWSSSGGGTSVRLMYDLTIDVPAVDPGDLVGFPECPADALRFRITGTVVGHRESIIDEDCAA